MIVYVVTLPNGVVIGAYATKDKAENAIESLDKMAVVCESNREGEEGIYINIHTRRIVAHMWKIEVDSNIVNC